MTEGLKPEDIEPRAKLVEKEFWEWQQRFHSVFDSRDKLIKVIDTQWEGAGLLQKTEAALAELAR